MGEHRHSRLSSQLGRRLTYLDKQLEISAWPMKTINRSKIPNRYGECGLTIRIAMIT